MKVLRGSRKQQRPNRRRARDIRTPLARQQQVSATEHVGRLVAVLFIVAVEEPSLLLAVHRTVLVSLVYPEAA
jgi:hypothetical protein